MNVWFFGIDGGDSRVEIFGNSIISVQNVPSYKFYMFWIAFSHHSSEFKSGEELNWEKEIEKDSWEVGRDEIVKITISGVWLSYSIFEIQREPNF